MVLAHVNKLKLSLVGVVGWSASLGNRRKGALVLKTKKKGPFTFAKQLFTPVPFAENRENGKRERQFFPTAVENRPKSTVAILAQALLFVNKIQARGACEGVISA